jgi:hypothetical protein
MDACEGGHVDDYALFSLGLSLRTVPLAPGGDAQMVAARKAHQREDVVDRSRQQHGHRLSMHDVPKIIVRRIEGSLIRPQLPLKSRKVCCQHARPEAQVVCGHPAAQVGVEADDGSRQHPTHKGTARDVSCHKVSSFARSLHSGFHKASDVADPPHCHMASQSQKDCRGA